MLVNMFLPSRSILTGILATAPETVRCSIAQDVG
jgi:hypothetical protein